MGDTGVDTWVPGARGGIVAVASGSAVGTGVSPAGDDGACVAAPENEQAMRASANNNELIKIDRGFIGSSLCRRIGYAAMIPEDMLLEQMKIPRTFRSGNLRSSYSSPVYPQFICSPEVQLRMNSENSD